MPDFDKFKDMKGTLAKFKNMTMAGALDKLSGTEIIKAQSLVEQLQIPLTTNMTGLLQTSTASLQRMQSNMDKTLASTALLSFTKYPALPQLDKLQLHSHFYNNFKFDRAISESFQNILENTPQIEHFFIDAGTCATSTARSIVELQSDPSIPQPALQSAVTEASANIYLLGKIWGAEEEGDSAAADEVKVYTGLTAACLARLEDIDSELAKVYLGALESLSGQNPDRARHVLTSLRVIWDHLLEEALAPNAKALPWVQEQNNADLLYKRKPTRRARLQYICRNFNHAGFSNVINGSIKFILDMQQEFNRLHRINPEFTDTKLKDLMAGSDQGILFILNISMYE